MWLIARLFLDIKRRLDQMAIDTSKILAAGQRADAGIKSVLAVLVETRTQLLAANKALADAIAANDPAATAAAQKELDDLAATLGTDADSIAQATQAPPA